MSRSTQAHDDVTPLTARDAEIKLDDEGRERVTWLFEKVEEAFADSRQRHQDIADWWDVYHQKPNGAYQNYSGTAGLYLPFVRNAVNARKTRFANQLFPVSGRHVEMRGMNGDIPFAEVALLEHYIRVADLKRMIPALLVNGDIEGQYNLYVSWDTSSRHVVRRATQHAELIPGLHAAVSLPTIEHVELKHDRPRVEVLSDVDVVVYPATSDTPEIAIENGGFAVIKRRWSRSKIETLLDRKEIREDEGEQLLAAMGKLGAGKDMGKAQTREAGVTNNAHGKVAEVYEVWATMELAEGHRLCQLFIGPNDTLLSCKRNPVWSDRLPLISCPQQRLHGSSKGVSQVKAVADLQYLANDTVNEASDSAAYALMPIIMTDPEKNPRYASMVLAQGAIWATSPNDTRFAQFPELWKQGMGMVMAIQGIIMQTMSVSPAQLTQAAPGKKLSQAEVAQEQQIDLLTTAEAVTTIETGVMTPLLHLIYDLDHQYREDDIQVAAYGETGAQALMHAVPPTEMDKRYELAWFGVDAARNAQRVQQQIAMANVFKGVPPQMYPGYVLDMAPLMAQMAENAFGPRLAPLIFKHAPPPPPQPPGAPPGIGGAAPPPVALAGGGVRPGAMPGPPKPVQGPPGMIHADQMHDPAQMPRNM